MQLRTGDTFKNSVGKQITVKTIHNSGNRCELSCPEWASTYHHDVTDIVDRIKFGHYTDYRPVKQQYEIGGTFVTDFENTYEITEINTNKIFAICIKGNKDKINTINFWTIGIISTFPYTPPQSTTSTMKTWKKEDFLNTRIIVDTPEKSRRFQELMFSLGIAWLGHETKIKLEDKKFLFIWDDCSICYSDCESSFLNDEKREIFYDEIFNNSNNQSITTNEKGNNNTNDISSTNLSGIGGEEAATACKYSRTGKTSSSGGYTGNEVKGRTAPIRVGRSEISFQAVAA